MKKGTGTVAANETKTIDVELKSKELGEVKLEVAVDENDTTNEALTTKIKAALSGNSQVTNLFNINQVGEKLTLESKNPGLDNTMGLYVRNRDNADKIVNGLQISQITKDGSKLIKEKLIVKVSPAINSGQVKFSIIEGDRNIVEVPVAVSAGDSLDQVAEKIIAVLQNNDVVKSKYNISVIANNQDGTDKRIVIEQLATQEANVNLKVSIKEVQATEDGEALALAKVTSAVIKAESSKLQLDVDVAQSLVTQLKDSTQKTDLQNRINNITVLTNLQEATAAVVKAETSKSTTDISEARSQVTALEESAEKTNLLNRLNAITSVIDHENINDIIDIGKLEGISKTEVKIYALNGVSLKSIDKSKIKFAKGGVAEPSLSASEVVISSDKTEATITLSKEIGADVKLDDKSISVYMEEGAIETETSISNELVLAQSKGIVDKISPSLVTTEGNLQSLGDTVKLVFDEPIFQMYPFTGELQTIIKVTDSEDVELKGKDYTGIISSDRKEISLKIEKEGFNGKVSVELSENKKLQDDNKNLANNFSTVSTSKNVKTKIGVGVSSTKLTEGSNIDVNKIVALALNRGTGTILGDATKSLEIKVRSTGVADIKFNLEVKAEDIVSSETLATKIKKALDANTDVMNLFTITQDADKIILESKTPGDDSNMGLFVSNVNHDDAIVKGTQISQETRKGSKVTKEKLVVKATPAKNSGDIKFAVFEGEEQLVELPVTVATGDTSLQIAEKVIEVLNANDLFKAKYSATIGKNGQYGSADFIIIEQIEGQESSVGLNVKISE